jgi:hypothetical protein
MMVMDLQNKLDVAYRKIAEYENEKLKYLWILRKWLMIIADIYEEMNKYIDGINKMNSWL